MISLNCKKCKNVFMVKPYRKDTAQFCSKNCAYTDEERAKKQSERIKLNPIPNSSKTLFIKGHEFIGKKENLNFKKGLVPWNKKPDVFINCLQCNKKVKIKPAFAGKQKFCSRICSDKNRNKGKTSEVRKLRSSKEYQLWRIAVFTRDNWTCIWCGQRGGELNADHIKRFADYPGLRFDINNGRTLCLSCHVKTGTFGRYDKKECVAVA